MLEPVEAKKPANPYPTNKSILICALSAVMASIVVNIIFFAFLRKTSFYSGANCRVTTEIFYCYVTEKNAWNDATYIQTISSFYTAIITILIAGLAVVAAIGAYTVRAGSKFQVEQELPLHVYDYFSKDLGKATLEKAAQPIFDNKVRELPLPEKGGMHEAFTALERKVEQLELQLQQMQEE